MTHLFFFLTVALYGCATAAYLACLVRTSPLLTLWAGRILAVGFTGAQTDHPEQLIAWLKQKSLR